MIGLGQTGGKVVDKFAEYDRGRSAGIVRATVTVNSAEADLLGLKNIPKDRHVLINQSRMKGHGVGTDNELDAEIAEGDIDEVQGAIDSIPVREVDVFLVVSGLGGGAGSGSTPVLAKRLERICTELVYGLDIPPGSDEGGIYMPNAAHPLQTLVREVGNLLIFDNDAWRKTDKPTQRGYDEINEEIVNRSGVLLGAGEVQDRQEVTESVVDSSGTINTLADGGVSVVGYASEGVKPRKDNGGGLLSQLTGDDEPDGNFDTAHTINRIMSLVRKAALGWLTLPCEIEGTERALLVLVGPPEHLNRKGIEHGQKRIEEQTGSMEARGGDCPILGTEKVTDVILLSGVTNVPCTKELQQVAIEAQGNIGEVRQESDSNLETLINDNEDELGPLF